MRNEKMELVEKIVNNQWVINIGTGIAVYIVTTIISKIIFNKATNKERQKQVNNANNEIIRILKPYVVEKDILSKKIISSIIESIARKFGVSANELYNIKEICEELIREILESSYVDSNKKKEYISYLNDIILDESKYSMLNESIEQTSERQRQLNRYRKIYSFVSMCMAITVMIISIFVTVFSDSEFDFFHSISEPVQISMLIIIAEIGMMLPIILLILKNRKDKNKKMKNEKINLDK